MMQLNINFVICYMYMGVNRKDVSLNIVLKGWLLVVVYLILVGRDNSIRQRFVPELTGRLDQHNSLNVFA